MGYVPLSQIGTELLFEVLSQRYDRGSIIFTSNMPFHEWTGVFGSERLTGALPAIGVARASDTLGDRQRLGSHMIAATPIGLIIVE